MITLHKDMWLMLKIHNIVKMFNIEILIGIIERTLIFTHNIKLKLAP